MVGMVGHLASMMQIKNPADTHTASPQLRPRPIEGRGSGLNAPKCLRGLESMKLCRSNRSLLCLRIEINCSDFSSHHRCNERSIIFPDKRRM
jgi:hypothetical protein